MQKKLHFSHQLQGADLLSIRIQEDDFDPGLIYNLVGKDRKDIGAKVAFTGLVKDFFELEEVTSLYIEHYHSMAKTQLKNICQAALERDPYESSGGNSSWKLHRMSSQTECNLFRSLSS